jgi:hypothetical protein
VDILFVQRNNRMVSRRVQGAPMPKVRIARCTKHFSIAFPTDQCLWRVSRADELFKLDTVLEGRLYMARLDRFKDPREGTLGRKTKSLLDKAPAYAKRYIIREYRNARRQSFASCWHKNDGQPSEFVWEKFGGKPTASQFEPLPKSCGKPSSPLLFAVQGTRQPADAEQEE